MKPADNRTYVNQATISESFSIVKTQRISLIRNITLKALLFEYISSFGYFQPKSSKKKKPKIPSNNSELNQGLNNPDVSRAIADYFKHHPLASGAIKFKSRFVRKHEDGPLQGDANDWKRVE